MKFNIDIITFFSADCESSAQKVPPRVHVRCSNFVKGTEKMSSLKDNRIIHTHAAGVLLFIPLFYFHVCSISFSFASILCSSSLVLNIFLNLFQFSVPISLHFCSPILKILFFQEIRAIRKNFTRVTSHWPKLHFFWRSIRAEPLFMATQSFKFLGLDCNQRVGAEFPER